MKISLLTGCNDKHYQIGLLSGLVESGVEVEFIGNDDMSEASQYSNTIFYNLRGDQNPNAPILKKIARICRYYILLIKYSFVTNSNIFHIQWMNKFIYLDRTVLNILYKLLGKKIVYTAHNVDDTDRDGEGTFINNISLKFMYIISDHIIVHTSLMKTQLMKKFNIAEEKISVIPHGIHDAIPNTDMTIFEARNMLGLSTQYKVILFFGNILPYKGLEYLILSFTELLKENDNYRLLIAGRINQVDIYRKKIMSIIQEKNIAKYIILKTEFIPDENIEILFKGADVCVLPYTYIFQSGILFVSYNFGLPVVASRVGSLQDDIIEGKTGYMCNPEDIEDLTEVIKNYFSSSLYHNLSNGNRTYIRHYAKEKYSWSSIGKKTSLIYSRLKE